MPVRRGNRRLKWTLVKWFILSYLILTSGHCFYRVNLKCHTFHLQRTFDLSPRWERRRTWQKGTGGLNSEGSLRKVGKNGCVPRKTDYKLVLKTRIRYNFGWVTKGVEADGTEVHRPSFNVRDGKTHSFLQTNRMIISVIWSLKDGSWRKTLFFRFDYFR